MEKGGKEGGQLSLAAEAWAEPAGGAPRGLKVSTKP